MNRFVAVMAAAVLWLSTVALMYQENAKLWCALAETRQEVNRLDDNILTVSRAMNHVTNQQGERLRRFEEWEKNGVLPRRKGAGTTTKEK